MTERDLKYASVIGIQSDLPGYKFCWLMNDTFDINFVRQPEFDIPCTHDSDNSHHLHFYQHAANGHTYLLYKLSDEDKKAFPRSQQFDYLWVVKSINCGMEAENIQACLSDMEGVRTSQMVSAKKFEDVRHLLVA